jgi:pilus assembly protein Flp/PilA
MPRFSGIDEQVTKMKKHVQQFLRDEDGLTVVEYAVAAGLIVVGVVAVFGFVGDEVLRIMNLLLTALQGA